VGRSQGRVPLLKTALPVVLRSAAASDVRRARRQYEEKRPGLGDDFVGCVDAVLEVVHGNADLFQIIEPVRQVRRALTSTFPFAVYYFVDTQRSRVVVLAVLPAAMEPARWRGRR
jgi:hypothetical protein